MAKENNFVDEIVAECLRRQNEQQKEKHTDEQFVLEMTYHTVANKANRIVGQVLCGEIEELAGYKSMLESITAPRINAGSIMRSEEEEFREIKEEILKRYQAEKANQNK